MKKIFIDTNVIIDFFANRIPFSKYAAILFELIKKKKVKAYVATISFNNTYYILRQVCSHKRAIELIEELGKLVEIKETNKTILKKSMRSKFSDFEGAIQYYSAKEINGIEIIVSRNIKDFKHSEIPVLSPETTTKLVLEDRI